MKKLLIALALGIVPIFTSYATELTAQNCIDFGTYWLGEENRTTTNFDKLPLSLQDVLLKNGQLYEWEASELEISKIEEEIGSVLVACINANENTEKNIKIQYLKQATLILENIINHIKTIETRARMPFVHHGNILPGPKEGESGSDYVKNKFIPKYINGMLIFMISMSILMIIVGGLMFIFSSGDSDMTSRAKTTITWAIVGVILTILSYSIVRFIVGINFSL